MAKSVARVNGRNGESMWSSDGELHFRTGGKARTMSQGDIQKIDLTNVEEARKLVTDTELVPYGEWTKEMPSPKSKSDYVVVFNSDSCWVMEISRSQATNALNFVKSVQPESVKPEEYKLYAAIQTPLGGILTIGTIVCILTAIYFIFSARMAIPGILFAIAAIVMFINVK